MTGPMHAVGEIPSIPVIINPAPPRANSSYLSRTRSSIFPFSAANSNIALATMRFFKGKLSISQDSYIFGNFFSAAITFTPPFSSIPPVIIIAPALRKSRLLGISISRNHCFSPKGKFITIFVVYATKGKKMPTYLKYYNFCSISKTEFNFCIPSTPNRIATSSWAFLHRAAA